MDGGARDQVASGDDGFVDDLAVKSFAAMLGDEGWVDVDDAAGELSD